MGISMVADILEDVRGGRAPPERSVPQRTERSRTSDADGRSLNVGMHVSRATLNRNLKHHPRQFHDKQAAELKRQLVQKQQKQQTITVAVTSPAAEPAAAAQTTAPDLGEDLDAYIKRRLSSVQSQTRTHEEDGKPRDRCAQASGWRGDAAPLGRGRIGREQAGR